MVNNSTNINKTNNHLSPQLNKHIKRITTYVKQLITTSIYQLFKFYLIQIKKEEAMTILRNVLFLVSTSISWEKVGLTTHFWKRAI